ncbi:hypothetical protein TIFTF001_048882 [Ficus carica]|uniref:Uncharacterized protein n=1 Tax=Ficus carica TaxID=3494 RepID=A0AA87ZB83_FICCA|nr:hypothetical protein TIFTF001_048882 [Ficus carica]
MWSAMWKALEAKYLLTKASAYLILIMSPMPTSLVDIIKQNLLAFQAIDNRPYHLVAYLSLLTSSFLHHQAKSLLSKAQREPTIVCHVCQNWLVQQAWFALFTKLPNVTEQCNRPLA